MKEQLSMIKDQTKITKNERIKHQSKASNEGNQNCKMKEQPPMIKMIKDQMKLSKDKRIKYQK